MPAVEVLLVVVFTVALFIREDFAKSFMLTVSHNKGTQPGNGVSMSLSPSIA